MLQLLKPTQLKGAGKDISWLVAQIAHPQVFTADHGEVILPFALLHPGVKTLIKIDQVIASVQTKHIAGQSTAPKEDPWMTNADRCSGGVHIILSSSDDDSDSNGTETTSKLEQLQQDVSGQISNALQELQAEQSVCPQSLATSVASCTREVQAKPDFASGESGGWGRLLAVMIDHIVHGSCRVPGDGVRSNCGSWWKFWFLLVISSLWRDSANDSANASMREEQMDGGLWARGAVRSGTHEVRELL